jgi:hypothetical protein
MRQLFLDRRDGKCGTHNFSSNKSQWAAMKAIRFFRCWGWFSRFWAWAAVRTKLRRGLRLVQVGDALAFHDRERECECMDRAVSATTVKAVALRLIRGDCRHMRWRQRPRERAIEGEKSNHGEISRFVNRFRRALNHHPSDE